MVIKNSHGKTYRLQGPNTLTKKNSKFWDYGNLKYVNFSKYGELVILDPVKLIEPIISSKEPENIFQTNNLDNLGSITKHEDNYLNDDLDNDYNVRKYNTSKDESQELIKDDSEIEGGSPVIYRYTDYNGNTQEKKIYAQIEHISNNTRFFIISKQYTLQTNNTIKCEWENNSWKILVIEPLDKLQKIITEKQ